MKLNPLVFLFIVTLSVSIFAQNGGAPRAQAVQLASSGDIGGGLFADFNEFMKKELEREDDEDEGLPTRPRIVPEKKVASSVISKNIPKPTTVLNLEREAFNLINAKRVSMGLEQLEWNEDVAKVARVHSQNMAGYRFFSHQGLDGLMVNGRADQVGLSKWRSIGENIAFMRGYPHPAAFAVDSWMNSQTHKDNLLNPNWKESAVGVSQASDGSYYFTQVFLLRK